MLLVVGRRGTLRRGWMMIVLTRVGSLRGADARELFFGLVEVWFFFLADEVLCVRSVIDHCKKGFPNFLRLKNLEFLN